MNRLAAIFLALLVAFLGGFSWHSWEAEKEYKINELATLLDFGARTVDTFFAQTEASLRGLSLELFRRDAPLDDGRASETLKRFGNLQSRLFGVDLHHIDGTLIASSRARTAHDGALATTVNDMGSGRDFIIERPRLDAATDSFLIPLRYAVRDMDGKPTHVISATLPVAALEDLWKNISLAPHMMLGLVHDNTYLLSRIPDDPVLRRATYGTPRDGALMRHLRQSGFPAQGHVIGRRGLDDVEQLAVFRRLANYPLSLFIGLPMASLRAGWWNRVRIPFLLCFAFLAGGFVAYRQTRQNQRAWEQEEQFMQERLRASDARWRFALEASGDGMWEGNLRTGELACSKRFLEMLGYAEGELGHRREDWSRLIHPDDLPRLQAAIAAYAAGDSPEYRVEHRSLCKDGSWRWFLVRGKAVEWDADGQPLIMIGTQADMTDQRQALQTVQEREERFRQTFVLAPVGIAVIAANGAIREVNPAYCRLLGYRQEELVGAAIGQFFPGWTPDAAFAELAGHGDEPPAPNACELSARHKSGREIPVLFTLTPVRDAAGQPHRFIVRIEDLSKRKQAQLQDLAAGILLAQEQDRSRLSYELHDEIGQSLTALKIALNRAQNHPADQERVAASLRIGQQILERLVEEVRSIAYRLRPVELDQLGLAAALRAYLDNTIAPLGQDCTLEENVGDSRLPRDIELCCFRVVQEALTNALRHACARHLAISLKRDGSQLALAVRDDGIGFDISRYYNRHNGATSLGLIGMRERVVNNGGQFHVRSAPGEGTEIFALFPIGDET